MLQPTMDKLYQMKLFGMAQALEELMAQPQTAGLSFEERLAILVDRETDLRENKQLTRLLNNAKLKQQACVEDIDFRQPRGLDRSTFFSLADCRWVKEHHNLIVTGPTGVGKTYIACALANKACRLGYSVRYWHTSRLLQAIATARADGSYNTLVKKLQKTDVLLLDDWGISPLQVDEARDLLDIIEDRNQTRSTMITSQLPISQWHNILTDPTLADAILDRLVHNAYKIELKGDSMRKLMSKLD
ncbi:MAG: Insertion sequence IS5376 putative ATP-binding protein [Syntrophomonadaceae bacterium]|nr:Insertion sequence IS5376 putative ATP-binding protein [Bacillota bacterium]MBT9148342.1 Insertion sequence IS5376 putative ATP-binding protein [Bacillota bacterium]